MGKKILRVYLAKNDTPYSAAYAKLELPASPWEVWDAMEKVRLQTDDILYMEIEDYFAFEYLSPHLDGLDISLNELNDLAAQLAALDEVQGIAFEGMFSIAVQRKVDANGGVITLQDLRDLAVSVKTDCYHVVDAADDAQLGRFYAENEFVPELDNRAACPKDAAGKAGIPLPAHARTASRHWRCAHGDAGSSRSRGGAAGRTGTARCGELGRRHGH